MEAAGAPELAAGDGVLRLIHEEGAPPALAWEARAALPAPPEGEAPAQGAA